MPPEKAGCSASKLDPEGETPWAGPTLKWSVGVGRIESLESVGNAEKAP